MDKLDILYTADEKFVDIMLASAISLVENSGIKNLNLHIVGAEFSLESYQRISRIFDNYDGVNYEFYPLEDFDIQKYNMPSWRGTQIANARIFFQDILEKNLSNINNLLYLDSDTIVVGNLEELGNYKKTTVAAAKDLMKKMDLKAYGYQVYYNSGVLYINVDNWVKNSYQDRLIENIEKEKKRLFLPDQDLLNLTIGEEMGTLPAEYNLWPVEVAFGDMANKIYFNNKIRQVSSEEIVHAQENPRILHACGYAGIKPWTNNTVNPYNEEFMKYLLMANPDYVKKDMNGILKVFAFNPWLMRNTVFFKSFLPSKIQRKYVKIKSK